mgnify:CR=1 FL=1
MNEELDSTHSVFKDRLDTVDAELGDVKARLSRLYDALKTGKVDLDDLSPRIRELRARQDDLSKTRVQIEAEMAVQGVHHVDVNMVKSYAQDLRGLLGEASFTESKAFLRSFVKRIVVDEKKATIHYKLPVPTHGKKTEVEVLPIDTLGGV